MIGELPATPPLVRGDGITEHAGRPAAELAAPTPQERPVDRDGGPLGPLSTCRWCGGMHPTACPFIKVAEWHENGQLSRVVLEERGPQKEAIVYPYEVDEDILRRTLATIAEATDLDKAQGLARALLASLEEVEA